MADLLERLQRALASRYRIERELDRGGMATVYLARDLKHDCLVAIKVLNPEVTAAIGPERFLREIKTVARLTHPHILPLHDSGEADELLFYVMPYVEGGSLRARLEREKQLSVEDALRIAREIAGALGYAHGRGVVHRDIKPENVLLEEGHAVVADFGIARAVTAAGGEKLTKTGVGLGTPAYMSPEQSPGGGDLDGRSDLYSLGCVLYEMLAGVPPFTGPAGSLAYQHRNVAPRPVTQLRPAVPAAVSAALERALAKTPADRFGTVALFVEALALVPVPVPPPGPPPWLAWLAGGAAVVLIAVIVSQFWGPFAGWWQRLVHPPRVGPVVILRFRNVVDPADSARFGLITSTLLVSRLASASASGVLNAESVIEAMGGIERVNQGDTRRLARRTHAAWIVTGNILRTNPTILLTAQVSDAASDRIVDAVRVETQPGQTVYDAADMLAERLVSRLPALSDRVRPRGLRLSRDSEADRYYVDGLEHLSRGELEEARTRFSMALGRDPEFVAARSALGRTLWLLTPGPDRPEP